MLMTTCPLFRAVYSATLLICLSLNPAHCLRGDDEVKFAVQENVIYGRKWGAALTMNVYTPEKSNRIGIIQLQSGGWISTPEIFGISWKREFLKRGYTVFSVVHGSQPMFAIPEILEDVHRSVRFIRHNAETYSINTEQIGIYGMSSGGHLSVMQGVGGRLGNPKAEDPIDRLDSHVQAVACFFPPTDFLNYGKPGSITLGTGVLKDFPAPFKFKQLKEYKPLIGEFFYVTDEDQRLAIGKSISPVYHVDAGDAPTLILHGDADELVPLQQAQSLIERFKASGVPHQLTVKKGAGHGWANLENDLASFADWFDQHLIKTASRKAAE